MNKKDVKTCDELQQYLQEQSCKSDRLFHYTTYDSLICIIKNKCVRLSRMDLMNDKAEQTLGRQDQHLKNYIMSFTRDKEYVSMWAMYGKPSGIKIRIDFSRALFEKAINRNFYEDAALLKKIPLETDKYPGNFNKKGYLISDVIYLDKSSYQLRHNEKEFSSIKADTLIINEMTGFIKYDAWEFEREIRLRALMQHDIHRSLPDVPKYIFAKINEELIRDLHITFNPWISKELKEEIQKSADALASYHLSYSESQNDGEISEL